MSRSLLSFASAIFVPLLAAWNLPAHAQTSSPQLTALLAQLDVASKRFTGATADVQRDFYEKVVHDTTRQKGTVYVERSKGATEFGAAVYDLAPDGKLLPNPSKVITYATGELRVFSPAENQVDSFKSGANQSRYESYLTLGFGGSGHDLAQAWQITDAGPETLTDNGQPVKVEKLILTSKDPSVQSSFKQVTLWIDPLRDVSLKQVFDAPSGDRQTATYSNLHLNTKVNKSPYRIPKNANVIQH